MSISGSFQPQFRVTYLEAVLYNAWNYKWAALYVFSRERVGQEHIYHWTVSES